MTTNIYIGWDSREPVAADVCKYSLIDTASVPVNPVYIKQQDLREAKVYSRPVDAMASTEFTFTRFLVPYLNAFKGWAVFVDCDTLWLDDVKDLIALADSKYAVQVVHHDYTPAAGLKMDGKPQYAYPKKNWSSVVLWNCGHAANRVLTPDYINQASPSHLHRFEWLQDKHIGELPLAWNWLVGWYRLHRDGKPSLLHYTEGGPWFEQTKNCEFADLWIRARDEMSHAAASVREIFGFDRVTLNPSTKSEVVNLLQSLRDPGSRWWPYNVEDMVKKLAWRDHDYSMPPTAVGIVADGTSPLKAGDKVDVDPILDNFIMGCNGAVGDYYDPVVSKTSVPLVVRGITKRKIIHDCEQRGRDYFYIDTGYFGNGKAKIYHRVTKNNLQFAGALREDCPDDRWRSLGLPIQPHRHGSKILICPPSDKAMQFWNLNLDRWLKDVVSQIKKISDREIVVRTKPARRDRVTGDSLEAALSQDVHCLVTFNSIAAIEALMLGKPVFTLGPNAASPLANRDLHNIDDPFMPSIDQVRMLCKNLAYQQFNNTEMRDGTAWKLLNA
jgi:lipopolysaccharide biosynthesis glycosyltransferase